MSGNLREHADKIKAAFEAAEKDGFELSFEWNYDGDQLSELSIDLNLHEWHETEYNGKVTRRRMIADWIVLREE